MCANAAISNIIERAVPPAMHAAVANELQRQRAPNERIRPDPVVCHRRHEFGEHGGVNMSVEASTTFTVINPTTMPEIFQGHLGPDVGGRSCTGVTSIRRSTCSDEIAAYEGAAAGYCTASGLAAIAATIMQLCDTGDHVVASRTVDGGTFALLRDYLPAKAGVQTTFVDASDLAAVEAALRRAPVSSIASRCRTRRCGSPTSRSWRRLRIGARRCWSWTTRSRP